MNRYAIISLGVAAVVVGAYFINIAPRDGGNTEPANDFDVFASTVLTDYEGNNRTLEEFRGKALVINSWAVWCPFCRQELPDFVALQKESGRSVTVIAIDRQEPREKAKGYTDELGITDDMLFLLDSSDAFYKSIGGFSMPETIFVDDNGAIVFHKRGPMTLDEMREAVSRYLQ